MGSFLALSNCESYHPCAQGKAQCCTATLGLVRQIQTSAPASKDKCTALSHSCTYQPSYHLLGKFAEKFWGMRLQANDKPVVGVGSLDLQISTLLWHSLYLNGADGSLSEAEAVSMSRTAASVTSAALLFGRRPSKRCESG